MYYRYMWKTDRMSPQRKDIIYKGVRLLGGVYGEVAQLYFGEGNKKLAYDNCLVLNKDFCSDTLCVECDRVMYTESAFKYKDEIFDLFSIKEGMASLTWGDLWDAMMALYNKMPELKTMGFRNTREYISGKMPVSYGIPCTLIREH